MEIRIKNSEWETPNDVDPIEYHAKRLYKGWVANWEDYTQNKYYILRIGDVYCKSFSSEYRIMGAIYMAEDTCKEIVEALNNDYLKIS